MAKHVYQELVIEAWAGTEYKGATFKLHTGVDEKYMKACRKAFMFELKFNPTRMRIRVR